MQAAWDVYEQAGITNPRQQIDVAELYVPFSWHEAIWLEGHDIAAAGDGWRMIDDDETTLTGSFPVNPSGGVLSSNPIGASGCCASRRRPIRCAARPASTRSPAPMSRWPMAYGANSQYFSTWVVASSLQPLG